MKVAKLIHSMSTVLVLGGLLFLLFGGLAIASGSSHWVGVEQTVVVATTQAGKVTGTPKVFTQLAANGRGRISVKVPMSRSGFRSLTGLGTPPVINGKAVWNLDLSGPTNERTVADFPVSRLPFRVSATYELNGQKMSANAIVGKSGRLKVIYDIKNLTSMATTVTFKNVLGQNETRTINAPVPMAALFNVTFPATFTNFEATGASISGNGDGTVAASWTMFFFNPLGGVNQSVSYQAQVTNATIPSATLEAQAIPPASLKPLPTISEPAAPAVPTITIGGRLASIQAGFRKKLQQIAAKASTVLDELRKVAVSAAQAVSGSAANLAATLSTLSAGAQSLSTKTGDVPARLANLASQASRIASMVANIHTRLTALPTTVCGALSQIPIPVPSPTPTSTVTITPSPSPSTSRSPSPSPSPSPTHSPSPSPTPTKSPSPSPSPPRFAHLSPAACIAKFTASPAYRVLLTKIVKLENLALAHTVGATATGAAAKTLQALALGASKGLAAASASANSLSAKAALAAATLANATRTPRKNKHGKTITPKAVGGGAKLDAAVAQLDAAITKASNELDDDYAYLDALDTRASQSMLPAGNASGATVQAGAFIYSISGANPAEKHIHLAAIIGATALILGASFGTSIYRIGRGQPSSLAPSQT